MSVADLKMQRTKTYNLHDSRSQPTTWMIKPLKIRLINGDVIPQNGLPNKAEPCDTKFS